VPGTLPASVTPAFGNSLLDRPPRRAAGPGPAATVPLVGAITVYGLTMAFQGTSLSIPMVMVQDEAPGGPGSSSALYTSAFGVAGMLADAVTGAVTTAVGYGNLFWVRRPLWLRRPPHGRPGITRPRKVVSGRLLARE